MPNSKLQTGSNCKPEGVETEDGCGDYYLAPDAHILTGLELEILNINIAGLHLLGQRFEFLERMPLLQFISMADRRNVFGLCVALLDGAAAQSASGEFVVCPPRRGPVPCSATVTVQRNSRGIPQGFLWRMQDSTARIRELESLRQQMEAWNRLAHRVSHEFNNLLMGIQIHADVARATECAAGRQESLNEICNNCARAVGLLRQLRALDVQPQMDADERRFSQQKINIFPA